MYTRAEVAQTLYDQGIGFFPLRGNHEEFGNLYGLDPEYNLNIPAYLDAFPQTQGLADTFGAYNFSSPDIDALQGLSYSFDYGSPGSNARFVIVDVEQTSWGDREAPVDPVYGQGYYYLYSFFKWIVYKATADVPGGEIEEGAWFRISATTGTPTTNFYGWDEWFPLKDWAKLTMFTPAGSEFFPGSQQDWISTQLDQGTRGMEHAFVFSHRPLIGGNHVDGFFGADPTVTPDDQNAFYASLADNDVKYMISDHDHFYNRALVESPDGSSQVEQLISVGATTKFYGPARLESFPPGVKERETEISQEANNNIGYYIYTVDGPRVTVDYYSDFFGNFADGENYPDGTGSLEVPDFDFVKKETWGYSLNGQQFLIPQGGSYSVVEDSFDGTTAKILAGANNSTTTDVTPYNTDGSGGPRAFSKSVNTGWVPTPGSELLLASDIFSLWGMTEIGSAKTDVYVLQLTYDERRVNGEHLGNGGYRLAAIDADGNWVNAVELNIGNQIRKFVKGPYDPSYGLGTYGIDMEAGVVWAVINYDADFAAVKF